MKFWCRIKAVVRALAAAAVLFPVMPLAVASNQPIELVISGAGQSSPGIDGQKLSELLHRYKAVMKRHRVVRIDSWALNTDHRDSVPEPGEGFHWCVGNPVAATLFGNQTIILNNRYVDSHDSSGEFSDIWTWVGTVLDEQNSTAVFVIGNHEIQYGRISSPSLGSISIRHINDDFYLVYEADKKRFKNLPSQSEDGQHSDMHKPTEEEIEQVRDQLGEDWNLPLSFLGGSDPIVTVGGFRTEDYEEDVNGTKIQLAAAVGFANNALINTGSVYSSLFMANLNMFTVYTVDDGGWPNRSIVTLHNNIRNNNHEAVTYLRNEIGADIMVGFGARDTGVCGRASVPSSPGGWEGWGYATTAAEDSYCPPVDENLAHEISHVMGAGHQNDNGTFSFSRAWTDVDETTIVGVCSGCTNLERYSADGTPYGDSTRDNLLTVENLAPAVSSYRFGPIGIPTPDMSTFGLLPDCQVATAYWDEPSVQPSVYTVKLDGYIVYRGGLNYVKVYSPITGYHIIKVESCLGDNCDPSPPTRTWYIPPVCVPQ